MRNYQDYNGSGWGHKIRREIFYIAYKYLGQSPNKIELLKGGLFQSGLQNNVVHLNGQGLEKVKTDPAIKRLQDGIIREIKKLPDYKVDVVRKRKSRRVQLGGQKAKAEMWRQALKVWEWADEYKATWQVDFNELTWMLRNIILTYNATADSNGKITIAYSFSDKLDLRSDWTNRSKEYNYICAVFTMLLVVMMS